MYPSVAHEVPVNIVDNMNNSCNTRPGIHFHIPGIVRTYIRSDEHTNNTHTVPIDTPLFASSQYFNLDRLL